MNNIKPKILEKKKTIFTEDINNIIGVNKCFTKGSYNRYSLNKVCDIDCHEYLRLKNADVFKEYIKKIANNKKILFVTCDFRYPDNIFETIYNKLGYTDGLFNIKYDSNNTNIIKDNIEKIPDEETKSNIRRMFNEYINDKTLQNFINIKSYVRKLIYPKWTLNELLKGEKSYFNKIYTIEDSIKTEKCTIDIIYLDEPYKYMSISNTINFQKDTSDLTNPIFTSLVTNNQINYYNVYKKTMTILRRIYFSIKNNGLKKYLMRKYEECYKFKETYGNLIHSMCINKNKLFIYNLKYTKNQGKNIKKENKYKKLTDKYQKSYNDDFNKLNNLFKIKYKYLIRGIEPYLKDRISFR